MKHLYLFQYKLSYRNETGIMDYCLLQFHDLKFFLGMRLHGRSLNNFNIFKVNPQIFQQNRKVRNISNINLRVIRRKIIANARILNKSFFS